MLDLSWTSPSIFSCYVRSFNGLRSAQMKREGLVGKTSDPCCFPRSRCTEGGRQQEEKNRNRTLIVKDKGHAESSVSVAETWSGRAGTTLVDLGHASFCPLFCLSVGMLLRGRGPVFVFLRRLSISKSPSAEPMIESDKWSLSYLKAATLY